MLDSVVTFTLLLAVPIWLQGCGGGGDHPSPKPPDPKSPSAAVFLFEWSWPDVAKECEDVLAPKGYDSVYVSPANEHITGSTWWTRYQPVSYKLDSRSGDEVAFTDMVKRCNAVSIRIIVDLVINHMATGSGAGIAGTNFTNRQFDGLYTQEDFHHLPGDPASNCGINFPWDLDHSRHNVWDCDLVSLPDLNTSKAYVQNTIAKFLTSVREKALMPSGVGFRIDAAKHMNVTELQAIITAAGDPWLFSEVVPAGSQVLPSMYFGVGHVTEFGFAGNIGPFFLNRQLQHLDSVGEASGLMPSGRAATFMDNHDTQRGGGWGQAPLTYKNGDLYYLANVFMLATPYGYPVVMSSLELGADTSKGPPAYPVSCGHGWICEHRDIRIANMAMWRRLAGTSPLEHYQLGSAGQAAFSRGGAAFVAINIEAARPWNATLQTGLPAGKYCNVMKSDDLETCPTFEVVADGSAYVVVDSMSAVALHIGKKKQIAALTV